MLILDLSIPSGCSGEILFMHIENHGGKKTWHINAPPNLSHYFTYSLFCIVAQYKIEFDIFIQIFSFELMKLLWLKSNIQRVERKCDSSDCKHNVDLYVKMANVPPLCLIHLTGYDSVISPEQPIADALSSWMRLTFSVGCLQARWSTK